MHVSVCESLTVLVCLCVSVCGPVCECVSVCVSEPVSVCMCLCVCLCACVCVCVHVRVCITVCVSLSLCVSMYAGMPAVTCNRFGKGKVYYLGSFMCQEGVDAILAQAAPVCPVIPDGEGLDVAVRWTDEFGICFVINFTAETKPLPPSLVGKTDLLTDAPLPADDMLKPFDVRIVKL